MLLKVFREGADTVIGDLSREAAMWSVVLLGVIVVLAAGWVVARRSTGTPARMGPAGWYADPGGSGRRRWFDGNEWTDRYDEPERPGSHQHAA